MALRRENLSAGFSTHQPAQIHRLARMEEHGIKPVTCGLPEERFIH